jgi:WD40 repeat protein
LNLTDSSTGSPMCCRLTELSPDQVFLIIGFDSGQLQIWKLKENSSNLLIDEKMVKETILDLDYLPGLGFGFCVSPEKTINCWRMIDDGERVRLEKRQDLIMSKSGASAVRVRQDGKIFAVGGWDGRIGIFASKSLKPLAVLQFHSDVVRCLNFSNRRLMAVGSKDGSVSLWNIYNE